MPSSIGRPPRPDPRLVARDRSPVRRRLARLEGQLRGIARMVDEERSCVDILNQLAAAQAGLRRVSRELLQDHMHHCVAEAFRTGGREAQERVTREMGDLLFKYSR